MEIEPLMSERAKPYSEIPFFEPPGDGNSDCSAGYFNGPTSYFTEPYRQMGPIFRCRLYGQERVVMGGVEANRFTWGDKTLWNYYKSNRIFREQFSKRYLNQLQGSAYTKKRRRINQGFKPSMLMNHCSSMADVIFEEIEKLAGREVNLRLFCAKLIICMTSRVLLQQRLPEGMDETMAISNKEMLRASSLGKWRHLWYWYPPKRHRRRKIFKYLNQVIDEREKNPVERDDIMSLILKAHPLEEPPIPRYELVHDLSQLFMGGSTTTAVLILWGLLHTYMDKDWLEELREELTRWDAGSFTGMSDFPKLRATCLEIERLRPSVPIFLRIAARDFEFGGYNVPKNTPVLHLHTLCHFLEEIYEEPRKFNPRRFLVNPKLPERDAHGTYGGGEHRCVGQNLARVLPAVTLGALISGYDLQFTTGVPSMAERFDVGPVPVEDPIKVKWMPRS